jgi:hypothetical protein
MPTAFFHYRILLHTQGRTALWWRSIDMQMRSHETHVFTIINNRFLFSITAILTFFHFFIICVYSVVITEQESGPSTPVDQQVEKDEAVVTTPQVDVDQETSFIPITSQGSLFR